MYGLSVELLKQTTKRKGVSIMTRAQKGLINARSVIEGMKRINHYELEEILEYVSYHFSNYISKNDIAEYYYTIFYKND